MKHWAEGGETKLTNLVLLCDHHHRFVHEHGYRIEMDDQQQPSFYDPRGRRIESAPRAKGTWAAIQAANQALGIGPQTGMCTWDGLAIDCGAAIDGLIAVDQG